MFKPLGKRITVDLEVVSDKVTTKSGIILNNQDKLSTVFKGNVVQIGNEVTEVEQGDLVMFSQAYFSKAIDGNRELVVIKEEDILGVLK